MARKNQEIKMIVHIPSDVGQIFNTVQVKEFWKEKIAAKIEACKLGEDERIYLKVTVHGLTGREL